MIKKNSVQNQLNTIVYMTGILALESFLRKELNVTSGSEIIKNNPHIMKHKDLIFDIPFEREKLFKIFSKYFRQNKGFFSLRDPLKLEILDFYYEIQGEKGLCLVSNYPLKTNKVLITIIR